MTVAEFLEWDSGDRTGRPWQLVDGEPVAMAPASQPHGAIQIELGRLIANHLAEKRSPCRVIGDPGIIPRLRAHENYRVPDLGVTCSPERSGVMVPDPVLLIEILSPNNQAETRANIWSYTTIPSVQEILIVHTVRIEVEILRRGTDGSWPEMPQVVRGTDPLDMRSIGLVLPVSALYRTTALAA
jgi:Uma2 family endonuclease